MARPKFEIEDREREVYTGTGGRSCIVMPGGLELYKPRKSGAFRIEIIPFQLGAAVNKFKPDLRFSSQGKWHWNVIYRLHGGVGPDNAMVVCPGTFGKPCPVCERKQEVSRQGTPEAKALAKTLSARERQLILVCERGDRDGALGPIQLWDVSTHNFRKQLWPFLDNADREDYEEWQRFWWPDQGMTMKIMGTEEPSGFGSTYTKFAPMELKRRKEPLPEDLFYHGFELYSMVREKSYDEITALMNGGGDDGDGDESEQKPRYADRQGPPSNGAARNGAARNGAPSRSAPAQEEPDEPQPPGRPTRAQGYESAAGTTARAPKPQPEDEQPKAAPKKPKCVPVADDYDFSGDETVWHEINGKWAECQITSVDATNRTLRLKVEGKSKGHLLDFEEAVLLVASLPAEEPKKAPAGRAQKPQPQDDPDEPEPAPKTRTAPPVRSDDDDDNLPLPPRRGR